MTLPIPDKGQVMVRYYGLYANAHRGKVRKANPVALALMEDEPMHLPSRGWAEMIRKVYEVEPLLCPHCGGRMKVIVFLTEYAVVLLESFERAPNRPMKLGRIWRPAPGSAGLFVKAATASSSFR